MENNPIADVAQTAEEPVVVVTSLDRARTAATRALEELGEEIARTLRERLEAVDNPARAEISALQAKAAALRESNAALQPRVAAKVRLLQTAMDQAMAGGNDDQAEALRAEAAELQKNLESIASEATRCDAAAVHLERRRVKDVEIAFKQAYDAARRATVEASTAVAALLDRTWNALREYDKANTSTLTAGLAGIWNRINLTPDDRGVEKTAFTSLVKWFGFGGRTR